MITQPGIYTIGEEYHLDPCPTASLSASIAKILLAKSPRHAWHAHPKLNPNYQTDDDAKFDFGSVAHAAFLEGLDVCEPLDFPDWRTKAAREARDAARASGRIPLLQKHYSAVQDMVVAADNALASCPDLSGMTLKDGQSERVLAWQESGIWCRAKLDWISNERDLILDYKTTAASASPVAWSRTLLGMGGEIQPAFYLRGNAATGGPEDARWVFLVQEVEPPYVCSLIGLSPEYLAWAAKKVDDAIRIWSRCVSANDWPGYPNRVCHIDIPAWAEVQYDDFMAARGEGE